MDMDRRTVTITIDSCNKCAYLKSDSNITRWMCGLDGQDLCWMGDDREIDMGIPVWCPLWKKDVKPKVRNNEARDLDLE